MEVYGGGGVVRTVIAPPQPAAGAGVTVGVPESEYQTLLAVAFRLVASAVVATRTPVVSIRDGSGINIVGVAAGFGTTASLTVDYSFVAGIGEWDQSSSANASGPLPAFPLDAGDSIVISVGSIDAGDQISRVRVALLQYPVRDEDQ